jgi:hypothetical protein
MKNVFRKKFVSRWLRSASVAFSSSLILAKMYASLSARTVNKYVEYIKQVVKSLKAPNGEPVHKRTWDAETMDLPVVEYSEQKRPSLKANRPLLLLMLLEYLRNQKWKLQRKLWTGKG